MAMVFKAVKVLGEFTVETLDSGKIIYTIAPFDSVAMQKMEVITGRVKEYDADGKEINPRSQVEDLFEQMCIFCVEFDPAHMVGIPIAVLSEMVTFIVETAQGSNKTADQKKTKSIQLIKS